MEKQAYEGVIHTKDRLRRITGIQGKTHTNV